MSPIPVELCVGIRELTEPRLSPSGDLIGWAESFDGVARLLVRPAVGGTTRVLAESPAPRTGRGLGGGCWCWTPRGDAVVFAAVDGELWHQPIDGSLPHRLTSHEPRAAQAPNVASDGTFVAYVVDQMEVWVVPTVGGTATRVDDGGSDFCFDPDVTPDSRTVLWQAWNVPAMPWDESRVECVEIGGAVRTAMHPRGSVQQPRWVAGDQLLCVRDDTGWANVWRDDRPIVDEPFEHAGPTWGLGQRSFAVAPDGRRIAFTRNEAGFGRLCVADADTGEVAQIARGVHGQLSWEGGHIATIRAGARTLTQIVVYAVDDGFARRVIDVGPDPAWSERDLAEPEAHVVDAPDGGQIHARLYRAEGSLHMGKARLICWLHGGPTDQWQVTFLPRVAYWTSRGWNVLVPDHRGSTGHGRDYQQALRGRWGELDVADTIAVLDHAAKQGWGTPTTTALFGGSSGGFTVLGVLAASTSPPLACAVVSSPVTDLADLGERSHRFERHYTATLVDPADVVTRSPVTFAERITTPLLVFHGDADPVVPLAQSELLVERMRANGAAVDLVVYQGEGHGFRLREHQLDEYRQIGEFLDLHAPGDSVPRMTEWNPADPDTTSVYYDLSTWTIDSRGELAGEMADAGIPHSWAGDELMVPEESEQAADLIIQVVETRLGIDSGTDESDALEAIDAADASTGPQSIDLAPDAATTEYGLEDWPERDLTALTHALTGAEIPFRWEERVLLVGTEHEAIVDALLDEIETGEYIDVDAEPTGEDGSDDQLPFETLTTFFLAGERLHRNPLDADGLEQLLAATEVADPARAPYGVEPRLWEQTCALAERVADALGGDDGPDEDAAQSAAGELHDLLRPYV